jgi:alpha-ketoglutarate-dependent 2,4-dichlorophenoxyacetate dioxygenase
MPSVDVVKPGFVARIPGVDLSGRLNEADFQFVCETFDNHAIMVFPDQNLADEQQISFSERFGPLEPSVRRHRKRNVDNVYLSDLTNVDPDTGGLLPDTSEAMSYNLGNQLWHSDSSFKKIPARASLLSGREVPPVGGETEFADMRAAWEALDTERQAWLADKVAMHSLAHSRGLMGYDADKTFTDTEKAEVPPVPQPMMFENPNTHRKALYVGSHAFAIDGMPEDEGYTIIRELIEHATQPQFVYAHKWRAGDLVMWDNRASLHRGRPWDGQRYRRVMRRTTVAGPETVAA